MPATTGKQATARGLGIVRSLASAGKPAKQGPTTTSMVARRDASGRKSYQHQQRTLAKAKETTKVL